MKQEGYVPERDIVAAFTADEEAGGDANGVAFLIDEHRALVDAEFAINPDGGEAGMKHGKRLYLGLQTSEKTFHTLTLTLTDKGGHSSRPTADNPIYRMARDLARLSEFRFPVHFTDTTRAYFAGRAALETGQVQADMRSAGGATPDPATLERLSQVVETNIVLRTTCTITEIAGGHAENALPQTARALVNCRMLPDEKPADVLEALVRAVADPQIEVAPKGTPTPSPPSPLAPDVLSAIEGAAQATWGSLSIVPLMETGATDGLYLRNTGMPVYGVTGIAYDPEDVRAHGKDERILVRSFDEGVAFIERLIGVIGGTALPSASR